MSVAFSFPMHTAATVDDSPADHDQLMVGVSIALELSERGPAYCIVCFFRRMRQIS